MTFEEIKQLLEIVREHELSEFELERDGLQDPHPPPDRLPGGHACGSGRAGSRRLTTGSRSGAGCTRAAVLDSSSRPAIRRR